jgi:hypothetical protein
VDSSKAVLSLPLITAPFTTPHPARAKQTPFSSKRLGHGVRPAGQRRPRADLEAAARHLDCLPGEHGAAPPLLLRGPAAAAPAAAATGRAQHQERHRRRVVAERRRPVPHHHAARGARRKREARGLDLEVRAALVHRHARRQPAGVGDAHQLVAPVAAGDAAEQQHARLKHEARQQGAALHREAQRPRAGGAGDVDLGRGGAAGEQRTPGIQAWHLLQPSVPLEPQGILPPTARATPPHLHDVVERRLVRLGLAYLEAPRPCRLGRAEADRETRRAKGRDRAAQRAHAHRQVLGLACLGLVGTTQGRGERGSVDSRGGPHRN